MELFRKIRERDVEEGKRKEKMILPALRDFFQDDLELVSGYSVMDYRSKTALYELKTRTNSVNQFETTMVGWNKIEFCIKQNKDCYFIFKFTDGLFYIKYSKILFDTFETRLGGRCDRGVRELKHYIYIPVNLLTKITVPCDF